MAEIDYDKLAKALEKSGQRGEKTEDPMKDLAKSILETKESFKNLQRSSKEYGASAKLTNTFSQVFGKTTDEAREKMEALNDAINQQEIVYKQAIRAGDTETANKAKNTMKSMQSEAQNMQRNQQSSAAFGSAVKGMATGFFSFQNALIGIEAGYQAKLMGLVAKGADGFQLFGAAMEASIDKTKAAADAQADAAITAAKALGQMGGVILPLVGFALEMMGERAKATAAATAQLAKQGLSILVEEGSKLIKTYKDMTGSGIVFANGLQGLVDATAGTKLRLEEMTEVVKNNREAFSNMGMGMSAATELIGGVAQKLASTTGRFAYADRQLLALGLSYSDQAALAAETASMMAAGGQKQGSDAVAKATMEMAKSMAIVAEATGADMKAKKASIKQLQDEFVMKGKMAQLAQQDPERYKAFQNQLVGMTKNQQKAAMEMQVYGHVQSKDLALLMANNAGFRDSVNENAAALRNGTASAEQAVATEKKNAPATFEGYKRLSQTMGMATNALGAFSSTSAVASDGMTETGRLMSSDIAKAVGNVDKTMAAAADQSGGKNDPTKAMLDAIQIGAVAAKDMQTKVVKVIGEIADRLKAHYETLGKAFDARNFTGDGGGGGDSEKLMKYAVLAMAALPIARGLLTGAGNAMMNKIRTGKWLGTVEAVENKAKAAAENAKAGISTPSTAGPLVDKNGKPLAGAALASRQRRLSRDAAQMGEMPNTMANSGPPGGAVPGKDFGQKMQSFGKGIESILGGLGKGAGQLIKGLMTGIADGIKAFADPAILIGAGVLSGAIVIIGAGIAGAAWIMGKALPTFAEGLSSFNTIDGGNLVKVGAGIGALGIGMAAFAAGGIAASVGGMIGGLADGITSFFGGKTPIDKLVEFSRYDINEARVAGNARALVAFGGAMAAYGAGSALGSLSLLPGLGSAVFEFFGAKPPIEKLAEFGKADIGPNAEKNARAFAEFAKGMALFAGASALEGIGLLGSAVSKFFHGTPPVQQLTEFGEAKINAAGVEANAKSMAAFGNAMKSYAGGDADVLGALGEGLNRLFRNKPPVQQLAEFGEAKINAKGVTDNAKSMAAFGNAMGEYKGGDTSVLGALGEGLSRLFGAKPPVGQLEEFSKLKIDGAQVAVNSTALGDFAKGLQAFSTNLGEKSNETFDNVNKKIQTLQESLGGLPPKFTAAKNAAVPFINSVGEALKTIVDQRSGIDSIVSDLMKFVNIDTAKMNQVAVAMQQVAQAKQQAVANPVLTSAPVPASASAVNSTVKVAPGAVPQKTALSAAEKAAVNETIATNTKYTNDLLIALQKNMDVANKAMIQQLQQVVNHSADTSSATNKVAKQTR